MSLSTQQPAAPPAPLKGRVEWEETRCLLCDGECWSLLLEAPDNLPGGSGLWFAVVQCQDCGLCFTNPRPSAASIGQFYPAGYRPYRARRRRVSLWRRLMAGPGRWVPRKLRTVAGPARGRLLDFGCGRGAFLEDMHRRGWQVTGIDASAVAVEYIRGELGLPALVGTLPHPELQAARFDVITMWHSLEHVHAPLEVLREAYRLLVPGGRLVVAVPNIDSLAFRWFGPAWYGLDLPRHLTHFAPWTLQLMLERAGFRVGPIRMVRRSGWMRWSARLAGQNAPTPRWYRWLRTRPVSRLAAWYTCLSRQSDCMVATAER
ncbi:MAG TPA: class I SAM-dependent methyltransferase [Gemmataceae bacterium]|nr:class I SAM-dependent methyltransferase [Gemmataceae bacterium]